MGFVQVERVGADVGENRPGTAQNERIDRGDEGKVGEDNFIARLNVQQQRGHLQRMGAGGGKQDLGDAQFCFEQGVAALCKLTIP